MTADLQDAVALAQELKRTPVQQAAKRVYDALLDAQRSATHLFQHDLERNQRHIARKLEERIEQAFWPLSSLMHEDDCE